MPEYSEPKKVIWYDDIPCPVCGAERTNCKRQMRNRQTFYVVWRFGLDLRIIELQVENKE